MPRISPPRLAWMPIRMLDSHVHQANIPNRLLVISLTIRKIFLMTGASAWRRRQCSKHQSPALNQMIPEGRVEACWVEGPAHERVSLR